MTSTIKIFVYGTLKPGHMNYRICAPYVTEIELAIASGQIYYLPFNYPAMTVEETGEVYGYVLTFVDPKVLLILDQFEQHDPVLFAQIAPQQVLGANQYRRALISVRSQRSPQELAWAYVMTPEQIQRLNGQTILDGCWNQQQEQPITL